MAKKTAQAFRTITEVSDWLDTPSHVLRFWESKFHQIKPVKRAGGRRYYRPEDLRLIGGIKALLHDKGNTIAAVQEMLKEEGIPHVETFSPEPNFPEKGRRKKRRAAKEIKSTEDTALANEAATSENTEPTHNEPSSDTETLETTATEQSAEPQAAQAPETASRLTLEMPIEDKPEPQTLHLSNEDTARAKISESVSKSKPPLSLGTASLSDRINELKLNTEHAQKNILEIEELYYQLQRIRNRMRRGLDRA